MYDYNTAITLVRAILKSKGYTVTLHEDEGKFAYTDGQCVYVPAPVPDWPRDKWDLWLFAIFHEIGHNMPDCKDVFTVAKELQESGCTQQFFQFLNLVDDFRQERLNHGEFHGRDAIVSRGRTIWSSMGKDTLPVFTGDEPLNAELFPLLYVWLDEQRQEFMPDICRAVSYSKFSARGLALRDKLTAEYRDGPDGIWACDTAEQELAWLRRLLDDEEVPDDSPEMSPGSGGEGPEGKGEGEQAGKRTDHVTAKYSDMMWDNHHGEKPEAGMTTLYEDSDYKAGATLYREVHVHSDPYGGSGKISMPTGDLSKPVRRLLQVRSVAKWEEGHRKGRLGRRVYRASLGNEDVFKRKTEKLNLDVAVCVLVDGSGSMIGSKYANAARAATLLHQAISPLRVKLEILGFDDSYALHHGEPTIHVIQPFGAHYSSDKILSRFNAWQYGGDNDDYIALNFAYSRLIQQNASRHVLITLSDGSPSHKEHPYNNSGACKKLISDISKRVDVYGIGIEDRTVERLYPKHTVINDSSELPQALLSLIKEYIIT